MVCKLFESEDITYDWIIFLMFSTGWLKYREWAQYKVLESSLEKNIFEKQTYFSFSEKHEYLATLRSTSKIYSTHPSIEADCEIGCTTKTFYKKTVSAINNIICICAVFYYPRNCNCNEKSLTK